MGDPQPIPTFAMRWVPPQSTTRAVISGIQTRLVSNLAVGLDRLVGPLPGQSFGILMYHRVAPLQANVARPSINVPPRQFRAQLKGLLKRGFEFWPLRRVLDAARSGEPIPSHVSVVTFDDGFECVYTEAVPILRELNIPATIFLATAYLDSDEPFPFDHWGMACRGKVTPETYRPMRMAQCMDLLRNDPLIELGAHTHTHQDFRGRPEVFARDMQKCVAFMREQLGLEQPTFAFPYGAPHLGFTDEPLVEAARRSGVLCGLTTASALVDPTTDPFTWGRIHAFPWDSGSSLCAKLRGWYSWAPQQQHRVVNFVRQAWQRLKTTDDDWLTRDVAPYPPSGDRSRGDHESWSSSACDDSLSHAVAEKPLISVVMPTFNRAHWLGGAIASLVHQRPDDRYDYEIVVVDNASTDATREVVAREAANASVPVRYVHQTKPGDAPTRNAGVQAARGKYIAFFDDDQLADPNWLAELYSAAQATGAAVIGGPVLLDLPEEQLRRLGPICRKVLREITFYPRLHPYGARELPGTGNALVERSVFERIGTFDESMAMGGSDSDFFLRARNSGCELWYTPRAVIRHRIPPERLTEDFFRWDSLSGGAGHAAHFDFKDKGLMALIALCSLRVTYTLAVHYPAWLWAKLRGEEGEALGRKTQIWRTEGYLRKTLSVVAPRWCEQKEFFEWLDFRQGRSLGKTEPSASLELVPAATGGQDNSPASGGRHEAADN